MNLLDVRTVMFSHVITDAVCTVVLVFLWIQNRKRFAGTSFMVLDFSCQTAAVLLILLRGSIPDWVSMVVSNTLVVAGAMFGYLGLARLVGRRSRQIHNYLLLAVFVAVHLYFVFVRPDLAARTLNVSLGLLVMCFQCARLALRRVDHAVRRSTQGGVALVFSVFCLVSIVRIVVVLATQPTSNDFFRSGAYDTLLLMCYQLLMILLTFALALMINQRLIGEVVSQEEKFTRAFRSSPYAITLTRPSDGAMLDVNDGFATITGYSYTEAVGRTTLDLRLWVNEVDRAAVVGELSRGNRVVGREYQFRTKSGELVTGLFSAGIIMMNDQSLILSSISDITERKRAEERITGQLGELRRWQAVMLDREDRLQELKREVNELCRRAGQGERYPSQGAGTKDPEAAGTNA
jgi:PAS domain S-box-containing protein